MIIINKTNQIQELRVYDFATKRYYSIYVESNRNAEIHQSLSAPDLGRLVKAGVFQVLGADTPVEEGSDNIVLEETNHLEVLDISEDNKTEEILTEETPEVSEDPIESSKVEDLTKFVCEICGGEYASARGLANHMNKAHK